MNIESLRKRARILSGMAIVLVVLVVGLTLQIGRTDAAERRAVLAAQRNQEIVEHSHYLMQHVTDAETGQRGYLLGGLPEYLEPYERGIAALDPSLERLKTLTIDDPVLFARVETIEALALKRTDILSQGIVVRQRAGRDAAANFVVSNQGKIVMDALRKEVFGLLRLADQRAQTLIEQADREATRRAATRTWLFGSALLAMGVLLFWASRESMQWRLAAEREAIANAALDEARRKAQAAEEATSRFLSTASHDLRQPLHAITLYVDALQRRATTDDMRDIVQRIGIATSSMMRIFGSLLDLSRLESGALLPRVRAEPLAPILESVAAEFSQQAAAEGMRVRVAPTSAVVETDRDILESIVRNLLSNAVKFGAGNDVLLGVRRNGRQLRIEVHDRGPGIAPERLAQIFEEFTQLPETSASRTLAPLGVGLGLAIVKRLSDLIGVQIDVRTTPGRGSTFSVTVQGTDKAVAEHKTLQDMPRLRWRLLVIENESVARQAIVTVLQDAGADVVAVGSAAGAEIACRGGAFDVVISDFDLGGAETGLTVSARLRGDAKLLIVTGATEPRILTFLAASGHPFLVKPIIAENLIRMIYAIMTGPPILASQSLLPET